jgi:amino acid transporter
MAVTAPAEITAAAGLIEFWDNVNVSPAVWISIFIVLIAVINFCPVRAYGESEVFFAVLKIMLIIALIIAGLVVDLGGGPNHQRIGFYYWQNPGAFNEYLVGGNTGKFLGFWSTLITAAFSYGTIQVVAIAGTETSNPRKNIPEATEKTGYRVVVFYIISILIAGMIVYVTDKSPSALYQSAC